MMNYIKFRNRLKDSLNYRFDRARFKLKDCFYSCLLRRKGFPREVHIENTNLCNAKCLMCPREKMSRSTGIMDFALFKRLIDECAKKWQVQEVHLHGYGECLIEKDFHLKVRYAKEKNIKSVYIVTNGSLLTKEVSKELISAGLDRIKISFYAARKDTYERIHCGLNFEQVENNVYDLFSARKEMNSRKPAIVLQFLPQKENTGENQLFVSKWEKFIDLSNGDSLSQYELHNYGLGRNYNPVEPAKKSKKCLLPFDTMQILWNGLVVPCCFDFNADMALSDVKDRSIEDAWNSEAFRKLRNLHRSKKISRIPLCNKCDQLK